MKPYKYDILFYCLNLKLLYNLREILQIPDIVYDVAINVHFLFLVFPHHSKQNYVPHLDVTGIRFGSNKGIGRSPEDSVADLPGGYRRRMTMLAMISRILTW